MADSQEAEITTPATEENVEVPEAASAVTTPAAEDAVAEDKEEVTVDQEKEGSVKEEATKGEDEAEAATEQPKEDEAVVEESSEPKAEEATSDQVAEEGEAPPAETEEGAEQTEVSAEPASGGETTVEGETAEGETTAEGGEEAPKADEIPVTDETTEEVEGEKAEGEDKDAEGDKKDKEGGEDEGGEKKEGEEDAAAVVEGEEKPAAEGGEGDETAEKGESKEGDVDAAEGERHTPLPQSDTFAEGERPESPGRVGEKLSREPTPDREGPQAGQPDFLIPESPPPVDEFGQPLNMTVYEEDEDEEEQPEEEQEVEPEFDREALIEKYHATLAEREQLQLQNYQLQHKLAEYFRKKKADERQDYDKNITDQEQRYLKYMAQLEDLRRQDMQEREDYQIQIEDHKEKCEEKRTKVDEERQRFMEFKKQVALNAINTRSGKPIPPKDTEQYLSYENKKELEVVNVRLENIKLKNKLKKKEQQLKSKEELAEGLHLIDFEQLKIENQTYNEKIEERNEELLKLRKKITSTVQVLTHLKEKLQFVQAENHVHRGSLKEVEAEVAQKRDILSRTKQARDSLRIDNQRLRQSSGLLGNEPLLRDFEERMDESDDLRENLERMKMLHAELTLNCNQVRRKIEQARSGRT